MTLYVKKISAQSVIYANSPEKQLEELEQKLRMKVIQDQLEESIESGIGVAIGAVAQADKINKQLPSNTKAKTITAQVEKNNSDIDKTAKIVKKTTKALNS